MELREGMKIRIQAQEVFYLHAAIIQTKVNAFLLQDKCMKCFS